MAQGQTRYFGYGSDKEYREAVAAEIDARDAASEAVSKPLSASAFAREAEGPTPDDLILEATTKLSAALTAHRGELSVNEAYAVTQQMIEGASTPEAAALAVLSFSSSYPDYAAHAVESMQQVWGSWGDEVLEQTVNEVAFAEEVRDAEAAQALMEDHVSHRADVIRDLSNEIAHKDGEAVRQITGQLASQDPTLMWGDDVDAAATLLGYRKLAKTAEASAAKEGFLRAFDDEVERAGFAGRLTAPGEREQYQQQAAETTAEIIGFDPATEFERGRNDAVRRVQQGVIGGFPFDQAEFDAEIARTTGTPEYATTEAIRERERREKAAHIERFGVEPEA